jgi:hypothetical protein
VSLAVELRGPSLEQVVKNHLKVARAAIRLKHSIQADNELEQAIPVLRQRLAAQMQEGAVAGLSVEEMLRIVAGEE